MLIDTSKHQYLSKAFTLRPAISNDQFGDMSVSEANEHIKDEEAQYGNPCTNHELNGLSRTIYKLQRYSFTVRTLTINTFTNCFIAQGFFYLAPSFLTMSSILINISYLPLLIPMIKSSVKCQASPFRCPFYLPHTSLLRSKKYTQRQLG